MRPIYICNPLEAVIINQYIHPLFLTVLTILIVTLFTKYNYAVDLRVCLSPIVELPLDVSHLL
jgi:hypothetical protein